MTDEEIIAWINEAGDAWQALDQAGDRIAALVRDKERLEAAMVEAIRLSKQPHYGDLAAGMDHYAEAMDVIDAALKGDQK